MSGKMCTNYCLLEYAAEEIRLFLNAINKITPVRNNRSEMISAWVGCIPKMVYTEFTLIFSMKNLSIPFRIR